MLLRMWIWCIVSENCERLKNDVYLMNKEAHEGADDTSRCSTTDLLRSRSNTIFIAAKNFEICTFKFVHPCMCDRIHAKSRVCPCTRQKRLHVERCNIWYASYAFVAAGKQVCNDCAPALNWTLVLHPQAPRPVWCPQRHGSCTMHRQRHQKN